MVNLYLVGLAVILGAVYMLLLSRKDKDGKGKLKEEISKGAVYNSKGFFKGIADMMFYGLVLAFLLVKFVVDVIKTEPKRKVEENDKGKSIKGKAINKK